MLSEKAKTSWREMSFRKRFVHCALLLGIPIAVWEAWDILREPAADPDLRAAQVGSGILFAVLMGLLTAFGAAVLEHGLFVAWKKRGH